MVRDTPDDSLSKDIKSFRQKNMNKKMYVPSMPEKMYGDVEKSKHSKIGDEGVSNPNKSSIHYTAKIDANNSLERVRRYLKQQKQEDNKNARDVTDDCSTSEDTLDNKNYLRNSYSLDSEGRRINFQLKAKDSMGWSTRPRTTLPTEYELTISSDVQSHIPSNHETLGDEFGESDHEVKGKTESVTEYIPSAKDVEYSNQDKLSIINSEFKDDTNIDSIMKIEASAGCWVTDSALYLPFWKIFALLIFTLFAVAKYLVYIYIQESQHSSNWKSYSTYMIQPLCISSVAIGLFGMIAISNLQKKCPTQTLDSKLVNEYRRKDMCCDVTSCFLPKIFILTAYIGFYICGYLIIQHFQASKFEENTAATKACIFGTKCLGWGLIVCIACICMPDSGQFCK